MMCGSTYTLSGAPVPSAHPYPALPCLTHHHERLHDSQAEEEVKDEELHQGLGCRVGSDVIDCRMHEPAQLPWLHLQPTHPDVAGAAAQVGQPVDADGGHHSDEEDEG